MFIIQFCSPEQRFVYFNMNWNMNTNRNMSNLFAFLQHLATGRIELKHLIQALAKVIQYFYICLPAILHCKQHFTVICLLQKNYTYE